MNAAKNLFIKRLAKILLQYALWLIAAIALGMCYMYLVLGAAPESDSLIGFFGSQIHFFALTRVGFIIGSIVFLLFLLLDTTLFKSNLKSSQRQLPIRIFAMVVLTAVVGMTHYLLEKTLDVI